MSEEFKIVMKNVDGKISCVIENMQVLENLYKERDSLRQEVERLRALTEWKDISTAPIMKPILIRW